MAVMAELRKDFHPRIKDDYDGATRRRACRGSLKLDSTAVAAYPALADLFSDLLYAFYDLLDHCWLALLERIRR